MDINTIGILIKIATNLSFSNISLAIFLNILNKNSLYAYSKIKNINFFGFKVFDNNIIIIYLNLVFTFARFCNYFYLYILVRYFLTISNTNLTFKFSIKKTNPSNI